MNIILVSILIGIMKILNADDLNGGGQITNGNFTDSTQKKTEVKTDSAQELSDDNEAIVSDKKGTVSSVPGDDSKIYMNVDVKPEFKEGKDSLRKFLLNHLRYPEEEYKNNSEGQVQVIFVVEKSGLFTNVKIERSSGYMGFDNEAKRVVKLLSGQYKPGRVNGRPVRTYDRIPILFEIEEE